MNLPDWASLEPFNLFLIYYDEVKYQPPTQESYWYGGIAIEASTALDIEERINCLSDAYFGRRELVKETEFHSKDIIHGKGLHKGRDLEDRLQLFESLLDIAAHDEVRGIYSKINVARLRYGNSPQEVAFMLFIEKVEVFLRENRSIGMLFGDYDHPLVGPSVATLSRFRNTGTDWQRGIKITKIIDTVHFAHSHHSRLIQLADVYLYSRQFLRGDNTKYPRSRLQKAILDRGGLFPAKYREYPMY